MPPGDRCLSGTSRCRVQVSRTYGGCMFSMFTFWASPWSLPHHRHCWVCLDLQLRQKHILLPLASCFNLQVHILNYLTLLLSCSLCLFWDWVSLSPGWSRICYLAENDLEPLISLPCSILLESFFFNLHYLWNVKYSNMDPGWKLFWSLRRQEDCNISRSA